MPKNCSGLQVNRRERERRYKKERSNVRAQKRERRGRAEIATERWKQNIVLIFSSHYYSFLKKIF